MLRPKIILSFIIRDLKISYSYKTAFIGRILGLFFLLSIFYYISVNISPQKNIYFNYVLIGLAYSSIIRTALFNLCNQIEQEQTTGTISYLFTTPHSIIEYITGTSISGFITGWIEAAVFILMGILVFNAPLIINISNLFHILSILFLGTLSLWGLGIISASLTLWLKKGNSVTLLLTAGIIFAGDVYFPSELLPGWLMWISRFNPVKPALVAIRGILSGERPIAALNQYLHLLLFAAVFLIIGLLCFNTILKWVKKKGTLEHF